MNTYVVATIREWNIAQFAQRKAALPGRWVLIDRREDLTPARIAELAPRYVFFPHWSWKVPEEIFEPFECVCFHMSDVPYGRGGSPLQNLIVRGHRETKISALRMVADMDAGPVYRKEHLSLDGSARAIFERGAQIVFDMIEEIARSEPKPEAQTGTPVVFERRKPAESELPADLDASRLYDFIRMLDADGYPPAFLDHGAFRIEFSDAQHDGEQTTARVVFRRRPEGQKDRGMK